MEITVSTPLFQQRLLYRRAARVITMYRAINKLEAIYVIFVHHQAAAASAEPLDRYIHTPHHARVTPPSRRPTPHTGSQRDSCARSASRRP